MGSLLLCPVSPGIALPLRQESKINEIRSHQAGNWIAGLESTVEELKNGGSQT